MNKIKHISQLLTENDTQIIEELIGPSCAILNAAVSELYVTTPPFHNQWLKQCIGVLCLINDKLRKGYFFKLIYLPRNEIFWEQQLYLDMEYLREKLFLHTFEGEQSLVAFNFAVVKEAEELFSNVQGCIDRLKQIDLKHKQKLMAKQKSKKTAEGISRPRDFRHLEHVGFNPDTGFDTSSLNPNLMKFFEKAGVSANQLNNKNDQKIVVDFLKEYGEGNVLKAIDNQLKYTPPPPPPSRSLSRGKSSLKDNTLPNKTKQTKLINTVISTINNINPPTLPTVPPRSTLQAQTITPSTLPAPPPPPPPAPAPPPPPAPTPAPAPCSISSLDESKASGIPQNLLESIRKGKKLNPVVETNDKSLPQINTNNNSTAEVDLAAVLKNALLSRSKVLSNESSEESDEDDEWE